MAFAQPSVLAILIGVQNDRGWRTLVDDVLDIPEMADDDRNATNVLRVQNRAECDALVVERTSLFTTADLSANLAAAGILASQVNHAPPTVLRHRRGGWRYSARSTSKSVSRPDYLVALYA
ncbi:MAG: CoA transferase [Rhodococcus sp. (in: high G+C Gram-positive bacteria)]|uniref:CoA transferase n=1 Tax=Rhodococcus sp. EPR-157 TaxID=1813677 RepID=UPI0007BC4CFC|nr:CoA transferase [Rhodococcus sp. EPR-157]KZF03952.1 hypothetical protein A2J03_27585 [Rhodococcus sp. EPR-157]